MVYHSSLCILKFFLNCPQRAVYYEDINQFLLRPDPFEPVISDLEQLPPDTDTEWFMGSTFTTGSSIKTLPFGIIKSSK